MLSPDAHRSLCSWKPVSPRIITARFASSHARVTVICAYAPTTDQKVEVHQKFYAALSDTVSEAPRHDMLIILGDFNAHTGKERFSVESVLGPFSNPAPRNRSGTRLIDFCAANRLFISNTFFRHKPLHRDTFFSPSSKKAYMLDLVLVNRRFRSSVLDTRTYRDARSFVDTDHELVVCRVRLKLRSQKKRNTCAQLNSEILSHDRNTRKDFQASLNELLPDMQREEKSSEAMWSFFKDKVMAAAEKSLPKRQRHIPQWMTPDLLSHISQKADAFRAWDSAKNTPEGPALQKAYRRARNQCTASVNKAKQQHWKKAANQLERDMKRNNVQNVFAKLRRFGLSKPNPLNNIKDANGKLLYETDEKLKRWCEYYSSLLNRTSEVDDEIFDSIHPADVPDDEPPPSLKEVKDAILRLKNRKSPGVCQITAEMLKHGGPELTRCLHAIISVVWQTEKCPQDWRDSVVVTIFKKKDATVCDNYRGISLLSIAGKVYALTLLNRVSARMEATISEHQCGFRSGRGTSDQLFTLNQILSNAFEYNVPTHTCFVDLKKAYDTVNRPALWQVLRQVGLSTKVQRLLRDLHTNTRSCIRAYGTTSDFFEVNNGVRQGCVLAPSLFNIFLDHIIRTAISTVPDGITLRYTTNGQLHISINPSPDDLEQLIQILAYADDMAIVCDSADGLERLVTRLDEVCQAWQLDISTSKTEVMTVDRDFTFQQTDDDESKHSDDSSDDEPTAPSAPKITLRGVPLKVVNKFKYLGRTFTSDLTMDSEISLRIEKATASFYRLAAPLYRRPEISTRSKCRIYKATVIPTLLYGAETWPLKTCHTRRLETVQSRHLRYILGIRFATHGLVSNESIRKRCDVLYLSLIHI